MNSSISQAECICNNQFRVRQHACLQSVQVPVCRDFFGPIGTYSNYLHTTLIEFSAQLFQSTQLADTVGSPMRPEKLDQDEMSIKGDGIEGLAFAINGNEMGNGISHLDGPGGIQRLGAYIDSQW